MISQKESNLLSIGELPLHMMLTGIKYLCKSMQNQISEIHDGVLKKKMKYRIILGQKVRSAILIAVLWDILNIQKIIQF